MKILAIETSCEYASVAVWDGAELCERSVRGQTNHSEQLLNEIRGLLGEAGWQISQLDCVAFGAGPGAFTGLRLACGVAQGLAMPHGLAVAPVYSLAALAQSLQSSDAQDVLVATDARMGEVYTAAYRIAADQPVPFELSEPACIRPQQLALPEGFSAGVGIGSAFRVYRDELPVETVSQLLHCHVEAVPQARWVAQLAAAMHARGDSVAAELAAPLYVRNKVALTTAEREALARCG